MASASSRIMSLNPELKCRIVGRLYQAQKCAHSTNPCSCRSRATESRFSSKQRAFVRYLKIFRVLAKFLICSLTTSMPRSSEALSCGNGWMQTVHIELSAMPHSTPEAISCHTVHTEAQDTDGHGRRTSRIMDL